MKNLISISNLPNVYGVKVPIDAPDIFVSCKNGLTKIYSDKLLLNVYPFESVFLGFCTATEISFDASEVVEENNNGFRNYKIVPNEFNPSFDNSEQSFRSALPEEIYFENKPIGCLEFPYFGAKYPDACCIDGYLHDMDKCDENGNIYLMDENHPCLFCNYDEFLKEQNDNEVSKKEVDDFIQRVRNKYTPSWWQAAESNKTEKLLIIRKV